MTKIFAIDYITDESFSVFHPISTYIRYAVRKQKRKITSAIISYDRQNCAVVKKMNVNINSPVLIGKVFLLT